MLGLGALTKILDPRRILPVPGLSTRLGRFGRCRLGMVRREIAFPVCLCVAPELKTSLRCKVSALSPNVRCKCPNKQSLLLKRPVKPIVKSVLILFVGCSKCYRSFWNYECSTPDWKWSHSVVLVVVIVVIVIRPLSSTQMTSRLRR